MGRERHVVSLAIRVEARDGAPIAFGVDVTEACRQSELAFAFAFTFELAFAFTFTFAFAPTR